MEKSDGLAEAQVWVAAARAQLGVRYRHQGRLPAGSAGGGALDCLGLLVVVARSLGWPVEDALSYGHFPDEAALRRGLARQLTEIDIAMIRPGDVVLVRIDSAARHLALVTDHPDGLGMLHAYAPLRRVVEHRLDEEWRRRVAGAYRPYRPPLE